LKIKILNNFSKDIDDRVPEMSYDLQDELHIERIDQRTGSAAGNKGELTGECQDDQGRRDEERTGNCEDQLQKLRCALRRLWRNRGTRGRL